MLLVGSDHPFADALPAVYGQVTTGLMHHAIQLLRKGVLIIGIACTEL